MTDPRSVVEEVADQMTVAATCALCNARREYPPTGVHIAIAPAYARCMFEFFCVACRAFNSQQITAYTAQNLLEAGVLCDFDRPPFTDQDAYDWESMLAAWTDADIWERVERDGQQEPA